MGNLISILGLLLKFGPNIAAQIEALVQAMEQHPDPTVQQAAAQVRATAASPDPVDGDAA